MCSVITGRKVVADCLFTFTLKASTARANNYPAQGQTQCQFMQVHALEILCVVDMAGHFNTVVDELY
jgi:hypothetical protein